MLYNFRRPLSMHVLVSMPQGEELNTFPSNNPEKCIDYIWFKGENIKIDSAYTFGSSDATDHKGIKAIFNIT